MNFLKYTAPDLKLDFEGDFTNLYEIILPKEVKVIGVKDLEGGNCRDSFIT
ncbi:MAG: hypothetical protein RMI88_03310 [Nitrososphaerota archaeon]|nr:hypothetical protein [Nitrososphaerota archaeon]